MLAKCRLGCVAGEGGKKCQMGWKGMRCWELYVSSTGSGVVMGPNTRHSISGWSYN